MEGVCTMWLSELGTFALLWGLKIPSITETDILWYDLRESVGYFCCSTCIFSPLCFWLCLPCIMNYQLCMTHGLTTANRHDHAWTGKWAPNISTLSRQMSLMRLRGERRQGDRGGHLYGTEGTWINYPTCSPLLNVSFMTNLRRTDCFILIWTCGAVLAVSRYCHFSKLSPIQNETHKNENVVLFCCHVVLENDVCWAAW